MARVVQQRTTPPYLSITLAFLMVIAVVLAIVFYTDKDKAEKAIVGEQVKVKALTDERDKYQAQIPKLGRQITGREVDFGTAVFESTNCLTLPHSSEFKDAGLAEAVRGLDAKITANLDRLKQAEAQLVQLGKDLKGKDAENATIVENFKKETAAHTAAMEAARAEFAKNLADRDAQLKRATDEKDAIIKDKDQRIAALGVEADALGKKIRDQEAKIVELMSMIRQLKGVTGKPGELLARQPDGKVIKVAGPQTCYINLGASDRVMPGLPFTVYAATTGIPENGAGKAKIEIVNVYETTSECRIVDLTKPNDPVIEGDLVANVIYNPNRTYNFVVEGDFDLYGDNKIEANSAQRIRALIEKFGGKVGDAVSVNTDFVIMGDEPALPPKPEENAPPQVQQVYSLKKKTYDQYQQTKATAVSLQIPILNTTRFFAFTGYVPKKRLVE